MKTKLCTLAILLSFNFVTKSQSVEISLISSAGGEFSAANTNLIFTVGDLAIETFSTDDLYLTQGFLQTYDDATGIYNGAFQDLNLSVYPNPTINHVFIEFESSTTDIITKNIELTIFDINGKLINQVSLTEFINKIDLTMYHSGTYILKITDNKNNNFKPVLIQKINY